MKITETETETETKEIEQTTTIEKIKCDVCGHAYAEEEWSGHEFSIDPDVNRESNALGELEELFDAYHKEIPKSYLDGKSDDGMMSVDVPKKPLFDVINEEIKVARKRQERTSKEQLSMEALKKDYADKIGSDNFYLVEGDLHHFRYVLNVEATTKDHKHVCEDCYDVVFD
jgi:hypothetical protein